jgi:hypothetical protein
VFKKGRNNKVPQALPQKPHPHIKLFHHRHPHIIGHIELTVILGPSPVEVVVVTLAEVPAVVIQVVVGAVEEAAAVEEVAAVEEMAAVAAVAAVAVVMVEDVANPSCSSSFLMVPMQ